MTDDIHHLSGAYALDAVDDIERARFEKHLTTCEDCRLEVTSLREAAAMLSATVAATPPPGLRGAVLTGISQVRPLPPQVETGPSPRQGRRWFPALVAAAAVIIAAVAGVWQPWSDDDQGGLTVAQAVIDAPDAQRVSADLGEVGKATVVRSTSQGKAVVITEGMAPAPAGKVFELWLRGPDGALAPAGLMPPGEDNTVLLDGDAADATGVGITVEPEGGSEQPTSEPIALLDLSQTT